MDQTSYFFVDGGKNLDYYTEGSYKKNPNLSMKKAQNNKFEWMCDQGDIKKNAKVTGCTISKDQLDICKKKKYRCFLLSIL